MAGKCCCAPDINAAKNDVLRALNNSQRVQQQGLPQSTINFPVEEIARRVADLLNPKKSDFEQAVLRDLSAIIQALTTLKARESDRELLLLIARNVSDVLTFTAAYNRQTLNALDTKATSAQAKDLLFAVTDFRRDNVDRLRFLAEGISQRFVAVGLALTGLGVAIGVLSKAFLAALALATTRILAAIAAIKIPQPEKADLKKLERGVDDLLKARLSLEAFTFDVPRCGLGDDGNPAITYTPKESRALRDREGNTTKASTIEVSEMIKTLLVSGKLECGSSAGVDVEIMLDLDAVEDDNTVYIAFPSTLAPYWFSLELVDINGAFIRTYKLAGELSEYGAGNWSIVDSSSSASKNFTQIYSRFQRLDVPIRGEPWGVRVSPKRGVSLRVTAYGRAFD